MNEQSSESVAKKSEDVDLVMSEQDGKFDVKKLDDADLVLTEQGVVLSEQCFNNKSNVKINFESNDLWAEFRSEVILGFFRAWATFS